MTRHHPRTGRGVALRASLAYLAALGLGVSVGAAQGGASTVLGAAGALLAAAALAALVSSSRRLLVPAGVALAGLAAGAAGLSSDPAAAPLYLGCFAGLLAAGSGLVPAMREAFTLASLPDSGSSFGRAPTIEAVGRRELNRARRAERPLTVASVCLEDARRPELARVAKRIMAALRETDLIGYAGGDRFLVIFVETSRGGALEAWERLCGELEPDVGNRLRAGFASFPDDNPTWEGLTALAAARRRPSPAFPPDPQSTALSGATVPNEA